MVSEYRYEPLKNPQSELRLIQLEPGDRENNVRCNISTYASGNYQSYRALSYVWGDSRRKCPITLNGQPFFVTANLEAALRNLRLTPSVQTPHLWIDAICIDQENFSERDEQVLRMRRIYHEADMVIIWLGDEQDGAGSPVPAGASLRMWALDPVSLRSPRMIGSVFKLIEMLSVLFNIMKTMGASRGYDLWKTNVSSEDMVIMNDIHVWERLSRLFHREWFERLWIIQELGVSRNPVIQCGISVLPWGRIESAAALILRPNNANFPDHIKRILPLMGAHRLTQVAINSMRNVDKGNILTALWFTRPAKCLDPRDRLFAILGVVEDSKDIEIDYASSVGHVYKQWATKRIIRTESLDVLSACADSGRTGELPSWVPDLRRPWGQDKILWEWAHYSAPRLRWKIIGPGTQLIPSHISTNASEAFSVDGSRLSVHGTFMAEVKSLSSVADVTAKILVSDPTDLKSRLKEIIQGWERWHSQLSPPPFTKIEEFNQALLHGDISEDELNGLWPSFVAWYLPNGTQSFLALPPEIQAQSIANLERQLFSLLHGNQMFLTKDLIPGIVAGNCEARIGDQVWCLAGGLTPFLLRAVKGGYRIISPCYWRNNRYFILGDPEVANLKIKTITIL